MKVKSEREVAQSYPTRRNPMDCSLPGSSVHGTFQARVLEWGAIAFSGVPSIGSQRVGHDPSGLARLHACTHYYYVGFVEDKDVAMK